MSMSYHKCCVPGCMESGNFHATLHLFPNPNKDRERFNDWVFAVKGDIIGLSNEDIYKRRRVCHAHFEEKFCCRFNRISNIAVPTLNLPGNFSTPFTFAERRPVKHIRDSSMPTPSSSASAAESSASTELVFAKRQPLQQIQVGLEPTPSTSSGLQLQLHTDITVDRNVEMKLCEVETKSNKENIDMQPHGTLEPKKENTANTRNLAKKKQLSAVPTRNIESLASTELVFVERQPLRQIQVDLEPTPSTSSGLQLQLHTDITVDRNVEMKLCEVETKSNKENIDMQPHGTLEPKKENTANTRNLAKKKQLSAVPTRNIGSCKGKSVKKNVYTTAAEKTLYDKLIKTRIKLSKCRNKNKQQSANLKAAKNIVDNPRFLATLENFNSAAKIFTLMQFREYKKKNKGRRFKLQEKILALSILKQAPKGYRFLRKIFILPAPQTLKKLINQANITPGINKKVFQQLKKVADKMKTEDKLCLLLLDEMFLKASVSYNEGKDKTAGFVTDGQQVKQDFADHAQVFMIRGLIKNYKQAISYSFSSSATKGPELAKQIKEIITELQAAGLIVVATVCDQGANNRNALKLLLQEARGHYLRKGEEPKNNVFLINDAEVIPLYDPPHLLKCVRNNLLSKNLQYTIDGIKKTAKWEHVEKLHKENPAYKGVRLIPKLSDDHVFANRIPKMKVKFASQVFSRTVATNMGYLAGKGILPKECTETADMFLFFDNLFDSQNGSNDKKIEARAKPLLGPVMPDSQHHAEWTEAIKILKKMCFINSKTGKKEIVPTLNNWAWTLENTEFLLKKVEREYGITSVWMRHLNQDPIENYFGSIRSHGCRNTNPTPERFEAAFTTLLINNMSSVHAPVGTNCEKDFCETLHALIVGADADDCKAAKTCDLEYLPNLQIERIEEKSDPRIMGPLQYISGYFIRNAKKKIFKKCKHCSENVFATEGHEYIKFREFAGRNWLCSPTEAVVKCISAIQDIANAILKENLEKSNLKELIKTHIFMFLDFDFLDCREHKDDVTDYLINLSVRFFTFHYCKDLNKILAGKRGTYDDEDKLQIKAQKYFKKCCKRKIK